ncbi:hypothetical protein BHE74_00018003 [Ensete ventricosum]|nr:hypothetical protein BHE74_00018003 [Ensete ventricosum]RZS15107.1 hypothetical protein BHM03_00046897 [Ensete ventricosum]
MSRGVGVRIQPSSAIGSDKLSLQCWWTLRHTDGYMSSLNPSKQRLVSADVEKPSHRNEGHGRGMTANEPLAPGCSCCVEWFPSAEHSIASKHTFALDVRAGEHLQVRREASPEPE